MSAGQGHNLTLASFGFVGLLAFTQRQRRLHSQRSPQCDTPSLFPYTPDVARERISVERQDLET